MIQVNFPISGTIALDIHVTDALAPNLNGYYWAIGDWNKKMMNCVWPKIPLHHIGFNKYIL
jgi:hypothetical protein